MVIGTAKVTSLPFQTLGDQTSAYEVTQPITFSGANYTVYVDLVGVLKGRSIDVMSFEGLTKPFDSALEKTLAVASFGRLSNT